MDSDPGTKSPETPSCPFDEAGLPVPCTQLRSDCDDCDKARQAEAFTEDKKPTTSASYA